MSLESILKIFCFFIKSLRQLLFHQQTKQQQGSSSMLIFEGNQLYRNNLFITQKLSFFDVPDVPLMSELRHIHFLRASSRLTWTIFYLPCQFAQFLDLQFIQLQLFLFLPHYQHLLLLLSSLQHQLYIYCLDLILPHLFSFPPLCLQFLYLCLQALDHVLGDHCITWLLVLCLFFVQGQLLLQLFDLLMFADIGIMCLVQDLLSYCYLLEQDLRLLSELVGLIHHVLQFLTVFLFISHYFQSLALHFMYVKMSLLLLFQDLQLSSQSLDLVFFCLNGLVIVHALKLSLGDEDLTLDLFYLNLLFLDLQSLLSNKLVLFLDLRQADPISLLLGFILQQDLIQLFGKFIDLRLEFDVLLDQPFLLILFGNHLLKSILRLLIILFLFIFIALLHLEALLVHKLVFGWVRSDSLLFVKVDLKSTIDHLYCQLLFVHSGYIFIIIQVIEYHVNAPSWLIEPPFLSFTQGIAFCSKGRLLGLLRLRLCLLVCEMQLVLACFYRFSFTNARTFTLSRRFERLRSTSMIL